MCELMVLGQYLIISHFANERHFKNNFRKFTYGSICTLKNPEFIKYISTVWLNNSSNHLTSLAIQNFNVTEVCSVIDYE